MRIRAVLFDIYGTLLVSNAGGSHPDPILREAISRAHAASPHPFPEVDIRKIYSELRPELAEAETEALAMEQECALNPVAPVTAAAETLRGLAAEGIAVGLVSNAQFYTVPVLEKALGASLDALGIDPTLVCLSYLHRRAKPDQVLFETVRETLSSRGIHPGEVILVGNDVRNDIDPAREAGFRTVLFAGDPGSLRLRGRQPGDCGAHHVITDLGEMLHLALPPPRRDSGH